MPGDLACSVVLLVFMAAIFTTIAWRARRSIGEGFAWRRTREAELGGEARLRAAIERVRPTLTARGPSPAPEPSAWSELFQQRDGGQLFVQGRGPGIHSESDVIVNETNPYAPYFLGYDKWSRKLRALAFPSVIDFDSGIEGVFCDRYTVAVPTAADGETTTVFSVCDDVASPAKAPRVRAFWSMLETVVLMHALHDREELTRTAHRVSAESDAAAVAHARAVDAAVDGAAARMRAMVSNLDDRMRDRKSEHDAAMTRLTSRAKDATRALHARRAEVKATRKEIADLQARADRGEREIDDTGARLERLRLKLRTKELALKADTASAQQIERATRESEASWSARAARAAVARRKALVTADNARHAEAAMLRRVGAAKDATRAAETAVEKLATSASTDRARAESLEAEVERTRQSLAALEHEHARLVAQNDAIATRLERETVALGARMGDADAAIVRASGDTASAARAEAEGAMTARQIERARLNASVRVGRVVHSVDEETIRGATERVHAKRRSVLSRQQALLDKQFAALDARSR